MGEYKYLGTVKAYSTYQITFGLRERERERERERRGEEGEGERRGRWEERGRKRERETDRQTETDKQREGGEDKKHLEVAKQELIYAGLHTDTPYPQKYTTCHVPWQLLLGLVKLLRPVGKKLTPLLCPCYNGLSFTESRLLLIVITLSRDFTQDLVKRT